MSNYIDNIVKNAVTYDLVSKPLADDMANEFSIQSTYAVGDYVMHDYKLYKCISAVTTAGNWNSAKWQECKIGDEINGGVKFTAQTLTSEQKAQARNNIGGASQADLEALNAVRYDQAQTLTTAQKTQARANIGAVSQEEATPDAIRYSAQSLTDAQKNQARVNVGTVASTSIAEEFSTSKAYAVGDMVMYNSKLYKFKTAHSAGAWNNAQVDAISVDDELLNLKGDLEELSGQIAIPFTGTGHYILLSGTTADINNPGSAEGYVYSVTSCSEGDRFLVNAKGGQGPRAWGFINSQNQIISVASEYTTVYNLILVAPANSAYLIINDCDTPNRVSYKLTQSIIDNSVRFDISQAKTEIEKTIARGNIGSPSIADTFYLSELSMTSGYFIPTSGQTVNVSERTRNTDYSYTITRCSEGDVFIVNASGGGGPRAWAFVDANYNVISVADSAITVSNLELHAPANSYYLIINDYGGGTSYKSFSLNDVGNNSVRYDIAQLKNETEKFRARGNAGIDKYTEIEFTYGEYMAVGNVAIGSVVDVDNPSSWWGNKYALVNCKKGDTFLINNLIGGSGSSRAWAFLTSANVLISKSNPGIYLDEYYLTAPNNAGKLLLVDAYRGAEDDLSNTGATAYSITSSGIDDQVKAALIDCFENVVWKDDNGRTYLNALKNALNYD